MTYHVYTTAYDEIISAAELFAALDPDVAARHVRKWESQTSAIEMALPDWSLPNLTLMPDDPVTLLVDCSSAQSGVAMLSKTLALRAIGDSLHAAGRAFSVLGYTTAAWNGGPARVDWIAAGRPANPGRLNALRHIIFHAAADDWAASRAHLSLMSRESLCKENIDGEALTWAAERSDGRILLIATDGPADAATERANPHRPDLLTDHRNTVLRQLRAAGREITTVCLAGIGGRNLKRYARTHPEEAPLIGADSYDPISVRDALVSGVMSVPQPKPIQPEHV